MNQSSFPARNDFGILRCAGGTCPTSDGPVNFVRTRGSLQIRSLHLDTFGWKNDVLTSGRQQNNDFRKNINGQYAQNVFFFLLASCIAGSPGKRRLAKYMSYCLLSPFSLHFREGPMVWPVSGNAFPRSGNFNDLQTLLGRRGACFHPFGPPNDEPSQRFLTDTCNTSTVYSVYGNTVSHWLSHMMFLMDFWIAPDVLKLLLPRSLPL